MKVCAILVAAGSGSRFGGDKLWKKVAGRYVWQWSYEEFLGHPQVDEVGIVASTERINDFENLAQDAYFVVAGGATRQQSVAEGIRAAVDADFVLIHDAARPFVSRNLISRVVESLEAGTAVAPAIPVIDTIRDLENDVIDRRLLRAMQTPQGGARRDFLRGLAEVEEEFTDDVELLRAGGCKIQLVEGETHNYKITTPEDFRRALREQTAIPMVRTGLGYDVHAFSKEAGRPCMIGGVRFEDSPGLEGHSDADVLLHAITDSLLGAAGLGDIGVHFPPSDPKWKNQPSLTFLKRASELLKDSEWTIENIDATVIAEKPKIMIRATEIRNTISSALGMSSDLVSVKATTNEGLGALGREEGIAAFAIATIKKE